MQTQYGTCRFCGQQIMVETEEQLTKEQLEEEATRQCTCDDAKLYADQVTKKERVKKRIIELCGEGAGERKLNDEIINGLDIFADLICEKSVKELQLMIKNGERIKIKMLAKDKVKIERSKTNAETFEE